MGINIGRYLQVLIRWVTFATLVLVVSLPFYIRKALASNPLPFEVEQRAAQIAKTFSKTKYAKMGSFFLRLKNGRKNGMPKGLGLDIEKIRAVLYLKRPLSKKLKARLQSLGFDMESFGNKSIQVSANRVLLEKISHWKEIGYIRQPIIAKGQEVMSAAVSATGANFLQSQGLSGKGVRIGIIDLGFYGYDLLLGSELPDTVKRKNFRHDFCGFSFCPSQSHGTAVAELIHDLAPDAELYLVSISTTAELLDAINWLEKKHVAIVNCSLGYEFCGPIDGRGWCSVRFGRMRDKGILPIVAAGNSAKNHWFGPNRDENEDSLVEIDDQNQSLSFSSYSYGEATVSLNWDDWGTNPEEAKSSQDIDLLVLSPIPNSNVIENIAEGTDPQSGRTGHMPIESVTFQTEPGRTYYIFIVNTKTSRQVTVHLFLDSDYSYELTPYKAAESLLQPADSPLVMAVGAANLSGQVLDFSSRGPTWDGRVKPDIAGFSGLETFSIPDFSGTSAAAPTVAGVAALLKEAHPDWGPDQLEVALELLARDVFVYGQDTASGNGLIDVSKALNISNSMEKGFWWNPERDGTGISIERGNNSDFLAIYTYRNNPSSDPTWFTASSMEYSGMTGPADLLTLTGWPLGSAPSDFFSHEVAKVSVLYLNGDKGLLQIKNPSKNLVQRQKIEKFYFANGPISYPDITGWWWDESQPGNGIFIEVQSGILFCAWYHFKEDGLPRWWSFSGELASLAQGTLTADILEWHGGPCLTCSQQEPHPSVVGTATLSFQEGIPETLIWQATDGTHGEYHLSRFPF